MPDYYACAVLLRLTL